MASFYNCTYIPAWRRASSVATCQSASLFGAEIVKPLCQVLSPTDPLPFPALTCPVGVALLFVIGSRSEAVYKMVSGKPGGSIFQSPSHVIDGAGQAEWRTRLVLRPHGDIVRRSGSSSVAELVLLLVPASGLDRHAGHVTGPAEFATIHPHAVQDHAEPARQRNFGPLLSVRLCGARRLVGGSSRSGQRRARRPV